MTLPTALTLNRGVANGGKNKKTVELYNFKSHSQKFYNGYIIITVVNYEQRKLSPSLNKAEQFVKLKRGTSLG